MTDKTVTRCPWARTPPMIEYHDREWGTPVHNDRVHFEFLVLEGAQAGLSWETILKRRDGYEKAFAGFDPARVARFTKRNVERLLADPGIIRNRLKVDSAISNAKAFLEVQKEFGSFDKYVWRFVDGKPIDRKRVRMSSIPARTRESDALSADLRKRGFSFVGTTICYAYLQGVGLVNDHIFTCFRRAELAAIVSAPRT
jgi:DNA-3-methyladenine glycosylase I